MDSNGSVKDLINCYREQFKKNLAASLKEWHDDMEDDQPTMAPQPNAANYVIYHILEQNYEILVLGCTSDADVADHPVLANDDIETSDSESDSDDDLNIISGFVIGYKKMGDAEWTLHLKKPWGCNTYDTINVKGYYKL